MMRLVPDNESCAKSQTRVHVLLVYVSGDTSGFIRCRELHYLTSFVGRHIICPTMNIVV